ncbi:conjugative transposon protein TraM [Mucilaginibacter paludis]|uniref:Conjugative transposon TraM protein n=1 Tax=Mucilaginibacter paludis DSM 18603 TaxID=714943 RepID=H1YAG4_9SPHI|nr:conjugative transposon protein TraM [Mucilaginibacter paludis]EHQ27007.1 conjugative transposon TraM protein [Mucilaginibacter paludis DSM 18603]
METTTHSVKFLRKRKFFVAVPALILPFITLLFWVMGGGTSASAEDPLKDKKGFNTALPDAKFKKDQSFDKMSYYDQAATDSAKRLEQSKKDPYYKDSSNRAVQVPDSLTGPMGPNAGLIGTRSKIRPEYTDQHEAKIYSKLSELNAAMNRSEQAQRTQTSPPAASAEAKPAVSSADVTRLEQMMKSMNDKGEDPEMSQLDGMLEKIMDIQNPNRAQEKIKAASDKRRGQVLPVTTKVNHDPLSLLSSSPAYLPGKDSTISVRPLANSFYSLNNSVEENTTQDAIPAVVHETQTIVNGSTVKLRLTSDVYINGVLIPKDNFIFGTAALEGERLAIQISGVRFKNSLFAVQLTACDLDGMEGIYIPGAITRDAMKQSAESSVQSIGSTNFDPSLVSQAAGAGIEAARGLFSKKIKLIKVVIKAGYRVLLRDEKQKQAN